MFTASLLYIFSPRLPYRSLCILNGYIGITITMQGMLLMDAIIIVKIIFIFYMKNPTAVQEDFWKVNNWCHPDCDNYF